MPNTLHICSQTSLPLQSGSISIGVFVKAATNVNERLRAATASTGKVKLDLYEIIDLRMLSGLMGEMFSAEVCRLDSRLMKNPNIDGYPDLCDVSMLGQRESVPKLSLEKFLAYEHGCFEVKNTFGVKKSNTHIVARASRIQRIQKKLIWKAHHRETNNLFAIHSDYVNGIPQVVAGFYSDSLTEDDWTVKQQPKDGSTMTSFCQTTTSAFEKLKAGLKFYMQGIGHEQFIA